MKAAKEMTMAHIRDHWLIKDLGAAIAFCPNCSKYGVKTGNRIIHNATMTENGKLVSVRFCRIPPKKKSKPLFYAIGCILTGIEDKA